MAALSLNLLRGVFGVGEATAKAILNFLNSSVVDEPVQACRHDATRKNIPPTGLARQGRVAEAPATRYCYDPHPPPVLRFDQAGGADRLIFDDSLTAVHSLVRREGLAGKVQMIYIDLPYGIKFPGNFQTQVRNRILL